MRPLDLPVRLLIRVALARTILKRGRTHLSERAARAGARPILTLLG